MSIPDARDPLDLTGKVAFVTGGTRGIGRATAQMLAAHGASVALSGRDAAAAESVAREVADETGSTVLGIGCDNADARQVSQAYRTIKTELGGLDALVNNAGVMTGGLIGMISEDLIDETLSVNTKAAILHLRAAAKLIRRRGAGAIVSLTSILGVQGNRGQAVYSASKAAVIGLTLSAAKELAPEGIRVNAIAPGFIATDLTDTLPAEERERTLAGIAMGRPGTADDVAACVLFLVSDLARYVTGQVVGVDGGMVA